MRLPAAWLVFIPVVAIFPLLLPNPYFVSTAFFIGLYSILTLGLVLLVGYTGQLSLAQPAFYGIGAYVSAILATRYQLPPILSMAIAVSATAIFALFIGKLVLRLQDYYLAVTTFLIMLMVKIAMEQWDTVTGGHSGVPNVPHLSLGPLVLTNDVHYYYLGWFLVAVFIALSSNLVRSRVGLALRAISGSEEAAQSSGIDPATHKLQVFVLTAVFAGLAGSIYGFYVNFVSPTAFGFQLLGQLLLMLIVGGTASIWGAVLGAALVVSMGEFLQWSLAAFLPSVTGEAVMVVYGAIIIVLLIFMPRGIVAGGQTLTRSLLERGRRDKQWNK